MKTLNRSVLVVLCLTIFKSGVMVQAQDYTFTINNGTITITGYIGPGGYVIIPHQDRWTRSPASAAGRSLAAAA